MTQPSSSYNCRCPRCGTPLPPGAASCPRCGCDPELTVKIPVQGSTSPASARNGELPPEQPEKKSSSMRTLLIVLAVVFVLVDVALGVYYFYNKRVHEEEIATTRMEIAESRRRDSIAAEERARVQRDSLRYAEEVKSHFVTFGTLFTSGTGTLVDYSSDEPENRQVKVFVANDDLGSTLQMQGYSQVATKAVSYEVEGGEMVSDVARIYCLNCDWDKSTDSPVANDGPWNCVILMPGECGYAITVYFDTATSRDKFLSRMESAGMRKSSSDTYTGYSGYRYNGALYVEDGICGSELTVTKGLNNSIRIN